MRGSKIHHYWQNFSTANQIPGYQCSGYQTSFFSKLIKNQNFCFEYIISQNSGKLQLAQEMLYQEFYAKSGFQFTHRLSCKYWAANSFENMDSTMDKKSPNCSIGQLSKRIKTVDLSLFPEIGHFQSPSATINSWNRKAFLIFLVRLSESHWRKSFLKGTILYMKALFVDVVSFPRRKIQQKKIGLRTSRFHFVPHFTSLNFFYYAHIFLDAVEHAHLSIGAFFAAQS